MKKQLFYLVLLLALIAGSARIGYAQIGSTAAENDATHRYIMVTGSTHTLTVARSNDANAIAWSVWTDVATPADVTNTIANVASYSGEDEESFQLTWARSAFGNYYIQVTETDADNAAGCAVTTRRFFVTIIDFDIYVYASNADGSEITGGGLDACGNGTTARYGDIGPGAAYSNVFETDGDLITHVGVTAPQTVRYISFQIMWHVQSTAGTTVPSVTSVILDFNTDLVGGTGTASYTENTDLVTINGQNTSLATGTDFVVPVADNVNGPITAVANSVIPGEVGTFTFVLNDRWNHSTTMYDLLLDMMVDDVELRAGANGTGTIIGTEPVAYENVTPGNRTITTASNNSATQTIRLAPATSTITIVQN